jgi:hypothetical protein
MSNEWRDSIYALGKIIAGQFVKEGFEAISSPSTLQSLALVHDTLLNLKEIPPVRELSAEQKQEIVDNVRSWYDGNDKIYLSLLSKATRVLLHMLKEEQ